MANISPMSQRYLFLYVSMPLYYIINSLRARNVLPHMAAPSTEPGTFLVETNVTELFHIN